MTTSSLGIRSVIEEDMKTALRNKDKQKLSALRLIWAAVKQREIDERITLDDSQILAALDKMIKQRRDSVSQYEMAGRQDLAAQESYEIEIIQGYLPTPLTESEIIALIADAIAKTRAQSIKEMGKVMGVLKPKLQGRADIGHASALIKKQLGG